MKTLSLLILLCIMLNFPVKSQWEEQVSPTTNPLYSVSVVDNSTAWICGRYGTVLKTTDGGANWTQVGSNYFQSYMHLFSVYAMDDQTAFFAYHQGGIGDHTYIFKTTDGGQNWAIVFEQTGGTVVDIRMFNADNGFMYTSPLNTLWGFYSTYDGGSTWVQISQFVEQGVVEYGHYNSTYLTGNKIFFGSNTGYIYHSTDGGNSWTTISISQTNSYAIWFNDPSDGLSGGDNAIEMTTDGGSNWSVLSNLTGLDSISAITGFNDNWWVANQNNIYYSEDNWGSWSIQYSAPSGKYTHMSKARSGNLIIAVRDNGGVSAYLAPVPVELTLFTAKADDNNVILNWRTASENNNRGFVVQRAEIGDQRSGGWEEIGFVEGKGTTSEENFYSYNDRNLEKGFYSYRLVQIDYDGSRTEAGSVDVEVNPYPSEYSLKQNFPNPFNPTTTIEYSIPEAGFVTIKIFSSTGEEIKRLVNDYISAGSYSVNFNASELPSGIYFCRMESGEHTVVKKMMMVK